MFGTHKLNDQGLSEIELFKAEMSIAISKAMKLMPDGREKAIFLTKIEEAVFFGTRAIAGKNGNNTDYVEFPEV